MNVIYQLDTYYSSQLPAIDQFNYNNMLTYGSHSVRMYANRINCDYFLFRPDINISPWHTAMLEKINLFKIFLKSKYSYFAFFDLDIKIKNDAINIFEIINNENIAVDVVKGSYAKDQRFKKQNKIMKKITGREVENYVSAGVFSCGKKIAKKICKYIKDNYFEELRNNDERFLSYVIDLEKIPITNLSKFHGKYNTDVDFLHYAGNTKEFMYFEYDASYNNWFRAKKSTEISFL